MFVRNGHAVGSILKKDLPTAERPEVKNEPEELPHASVEVDDVDQGDPQIGTRPDDAHAGDVIDPPPAVEESKPEPIPVVKRAPGRPRKNLGD